MAWAVITSSIVGNSDLIMMLLCVVYRLFQLSGDAMCYSQQACGRVVSSDSNERDL
jgi:hypothetical protein